MDRYAVLGPHTFTEAALDQYLDTQHLEGEKIYASSIDETFDLINDGNADIAIAPQSNSIAGDVAEIPENWDPDRHQIVALTQMGIELCLILDENAEPSTITHIASKKEALNQCTKYLQENFPKAKHLYTDSTAAAVDAISPTQAALAGAFAVKPGTKIHAQGIEDEGSTTNFIIFKANPS